MLKVCIIAQILVEKDRMNTKIIGFDPASTRNLGWSLFEYTVKGGFDLTRFQSSTVRLATTPERWQVLGPVSIAVDEFLAKESPNLVVIEQTASFRGSFITGQVSHCIGVILAACSRQDIDVGFVYPTHVKKVMTGKGKATKPQMKKAVIRSLKDLGVKNIKFDSDHAADATSNILTWLADKDIIKIDLKES